MKTRDKFGLASLALLGIAVGCWLFGSSDRTAGMVLFRAGLVLGSIWLAWPDLAKIPRWASVGGVVSLILIARFPMLAAVILPGLALVRWVMK